MKLDEELEMRVWERGKEIAKDFGVLDEYLELKRKVEREKDKEWKKYVKYVKSRGGDNPMSERIKEEHISSGLDSIDKYAGQPIILINIETGKVIPGGRVVSEEKALATPCHGYDLGEGKKMLWSKGVVGTLSLPEQEKFCKVGMDLKPMTGTLARRITALREAGIRFK